MFGAVTEKFQNLFQQISQKRLKESNISDAVRQVRLALLDADVNYGVVSRFVKGIKEQALGDEVLKSVDPGDQFISIIHKELVKLMGSEEAKIDLKGQPATFLLCGLQGSGKTTTAAKLALYLKKKPFNKNPLLIACDLQRAAAIEQLTHLGSQIDVPVFTEKGPPKQVAKKGLEYAKQQGHDVVIIDSAGRLHIDDELMNELKEIKKIANPQEILFVASALIGQDAVKTAQTFDEMIGITGSILTMLDGNARAGAALSILEVTNKPLKFEGVGETPDDFQLFNPESMADRILGMGDVINLVKKAEATLDEKETEDFEEKLKKASFTYDDYLKQMNSIKKMGSFKGLLKMMPGMGAMGDLDLDEKELKQTEAIIQSMTQRERECLDELTPSRRRRVARGSGTTIDDVNRLAKGFKNIKKLFKGIPKSKNKLKKQFGISDAMLDKFF